MTAPTLRRLDVKKQFIKEAKTFIKEALRGEV